MAHARRGARRAVRGTQVARRGRRASLGSWPPRVPLGPASARGDFREAPPGAWRRRRARPPLAHWWPRRGRGEIAGSVPLGRPRARHPDQAASAPSRHRAHRLPPQHVARRCARCRRPRAPPGPPLPVGRRHPWGAGPQPAARGLLQSGEAAGLARFRRLFVLSRVRSPLGAKALGLFVPQFTQLGLEGFAAVYSHTPSLPPRRAFWLLRRLGQTPLHHPTVTWVVYWFSSVRAAAAPTLGVPFSPPSAPSSSAFRPLSCPCVSVAPSPSPT